MDGENSNDSTASRQFSGREGGAPADAQALSHVNERGQAHMVDVGEKQVTTREARAEGWVAMLPETLTLIRDNTAAKGDVLATARIAGIMAAKRTDELIPLCHTLGLTSASVDFQFVQDPPSLHILSTARTDGRTGVEMEALAAVAAAALTVYDMCKAVDRGMSIEGVRLTYKSGGRSGTYQRQSEASGPPAD